MHELFEELMGVAKVKSLQLEVAIISKPGLPREELERVKKEDEDFQIYLEVLPAGTHITITITDRQNRVWDLEPVLSKKCSMKSK